MNSTFLRWIYVLRPPSSQLAPSPSIEFPYSKLMFCILVFWSIRHIGFGPVTPVQQCVVNRRIYFTARQMCVQVCIRVWWKSENRHRIISVYLLALILCIKLIYLLEIVIPLCCIWMALSVLTNPWKLWFYHKLWHNIQYDLFIKTWLYNIYHL